MHDQVILSKPVGLVSFILLWPSLLNSTLSIWISQNILIISDIWLIQKAKKSLMWISHITVITSVKINWFNRDIYLFHCSEKKDLIESKKIICLNDFLWFKEMICLNEIKFVWLKQNIFEPNKYLFESN